MNLRYVLPSLLKIRSPLLTDYCILRAIKYYNWEMPGSDYNVFLHLLLPVHSRNAKSGRDNPPYEMKQESVFSTPHEHIELF